MLAPDLAGNCGTRVTVEPGGCCGKLLTDKKKGPESAVPDAFPTQEKQQ
jgi:hypothetical protein